MSLTFIQLWEEVCGTYRKSGRRMQSEEGEEEKNKSRKGKKRERMESWGLFNIWTHKSMFQHVENQKDVGSSRNFQLCVLCIPPFPLSFSYLIGHGRGLLTYCNWSLCTPAANQHISSSLRTTVSSLPVHWSPWSPSASLTTDTSGYLLPLLPSYSPALLFILLDSVYIPVKSVNLLPLSLSALGPWTWKDNFDIFLREMTLQVNKNRSKDNSVNLFSLFRRGEPF